jgi:TRAP-type C4-dicarboxylate transport system permease small subunit
MTKAGALQLLDRAEETLAGALLVIVMAITAYNIVNRYVFQLSAVWAPELAGFLFTWVVFLGASAAARRGMHVSMEAVVDRLSPRARRWILLAGQVILVAFFAHTAWLALRIMISSYSRVSPVLHVPYSYVYASVVISFSLMLARSVAALWREFRSDAAARGA